MSNPILFLDEGFISREVVAAAESTCFSANLQWTSTLLLRRGFAESRTTSLNGMI
jgi:hypothetical protein